MPRGTVAAVAAMLPCRYGLCYLHETIPIEFGATKEIVLPLGDEKRIRQTIGWSTNRHIFNSCFHNEL